MFAGKFTCPKKTKQFWQIQENSTWQSAQPEIFQGRRSFLKLGDFDKHFVKNTSKKIPAGKYFRVFWRQSLTQGWTQSEPFFSKIKEPDFSIFKKEQGNSLPFLPPTCGTAETSPLFVPFLILLIIRANSPNCFLGSREFLLKSSVVIFGKPFRVQFFYKQLGSGLSPQSWSCLYFQGF